jgi:hypothetical protein
MCRRADEFRSQSVACAVSIYRKHVSGRPPCLTCHFQPSQCHGQCVRPRECQQQSNCMCGWIKSPMRVHIRLRTPNLLQLDCPAVFSPCSFFFWLANHVLAHRLSSPICRIWCFSAPNHRFANMLLSPRCVTEILSSPSGRCRNSLVYGFTAFSLYSIPSVSCVKNLGSRRSISQSDESSGVMRLEHARRNRFASAIIQNHVVHPRVLSVGRLFFFLSRDCRNKSICPECRHVEH